MRKVGRGPAAPAMKGQVLQATAEARACQTLMSAKVLSIFFLPNACYFCFETPVFHCVFLATCGLGGSAWQ